MGAKITLSVIKADVGGFVGHSSMHADIIDKAKGNLAAAQAEGRILDVPAIFTRKERWYV